MNNFDAIFDKIGGYGYYQRYVTFFILNTAGLSALNIMQVIFTCYGPKFTCLQYDDNVLLSENYTNICEIQNFTDRCIKLQYDESVVRSSIVTEFNLVCEKEWLSSLSKTVLMIGMFFGICTSALADIFGRKKLFVILLFVMIIFKLISAFSTSYWLFTLTKFCIGATTIGIYTIGFILAIELVSTKYSAWIGALAVMLWSLWCFVIPLLAYFIQDRKWFEIVLTSIDIISVICVWFIPESPKWLIIKNRQDEAFKVIAKIAEKNGCPDFDINEISMQTTQERTDDNESFIKVFSNPILLIRVVILGIYWFCTSLVFYGISLNIGDLYGSIFVNTSISIAVELFAYLFVSPILLCVGRKKCLIVTMILSGVLLCLFLFVPKFVSTVLALAGKAFISFAFTVIYIYTGEIYPTTIRARGLGLGSICARIGGAVAPFMMTRQGKFNEAGIIGAGVISILAGLLMLSQPETKNKPTPQKMADIDLKNNFKCDCLILRGNTVGAM